MYHSYRHVTSVFFFVSLLRSIAVFLPRMIMQALYLMDCYTLCLSELFLQIGTQAGALCWQLSGRGEEIVDILQKECLRCGILPTKASITR